MLPIQKVYNAIVGEIAAKELKIEAVVAAWPDSIFDYRPHGSSWHELERVENTSFYGLSSSDAHRVSFQAHDLVIADVAAAKTILAEHEATQKHQQLARPGGKLIAKLSDWYADRFGNGAGPQLVGSDALIRDRDDLMNTARILKVAMAPQDAGYTLSNNHGCGAQSPVAQIDRLNLSDEDVAKKDWPKIDSVVSEALKPRWLEQAIVDTRDQVEYGDKLGKRYGQVRMVFGENAGGQSNAPVAALYSTQYNWTTLFADPKAAESVYRTFTSPEYYLGRIGCIDAKCSPVDKRYFSEALLDPPFTPVPLCHEKPSAFEIADAGIANSGSTADKSAVKFGHG